MDYAVQLRSNLNILKFRLLNTSLTLADTLQLFSHYVAHSRIKLDEISMPTEKGLFIKFADENDVMYITDTIIKNFPMNTKREFITMLDTHYDDHSIIYCNINLCGNIGAISVLSI
jgi:hypothetical protein